MMNRWMMDRPVPFFPVFLLPGLMGPLLLVVLPAVALLRFLRRHAGGLITFLVLLALIRPFFFY